MFATHNLLWLLLFLWCFHQVDAQTCQSGPNTNQQLGAHQTETLVLTILIIFHQLCRTKSTDMRQWNCRRTLDKTTTNDFQGKESELLYVYRQLAMAFETNVWDDPHPPAMKPSQPIAESKAVFSTGMNMMVLKPTFLVSPFTVWVKSRLYHILSDHIWIVLL